MAAFAREQRPHPAHSKLREGTAVRLLAVAVVVVAVPGWSGRRVCFNHRIDDLDGGYDRCIVRIPDTIADQLQKATIDNIPRGKITLLAGRMIGDMQQPGVFVFGRMLLADLLGQDAHKVF